MKESLVLLCAFLCCYIVVALLLQLHNISYRINMPLRKNTNLAQPYEGGNTDVYHDNLETEVLIVGAGFGRVYLMHKLRDELGFDCRIYEAVKDLGGFWHWNCYPGARVDMQVPIHEYSIEKMWKVSNLTCDLSKVFAMQILVEQPGLDMGTEISRLARTPQPPRLRRRETPDQERQRFRLTSCRRSIQPQNTQVGRQDSGRAYRARKVPHKRHHFRRKAPLPRLAGFGLVQGRDVPFFVLAGRESFHKG
jgi:hypothetical protein